MSDNPKKNSVRIQNKEITMPLIVNAIKEHSKNELVNHQESFLYFVKKGILWWKEQNSNSKVNS